MAAIDRIAIGVAIFWAMVCVVMVGVRSVNDPFADRLQKLDARLQAIKPPEGLSSEEEEQNRPLLVMDITRKQTLWRELIPPPKKPPAKVPPPNLEKMLEGVRPSLREEIRIGDSRLVRVRQQQDQDGRFMAVGDRMRGLTIVEIRDDALVFELKKGGETFRHELKRK